MVNWKKLFLEEDEDEIFEEEISRKEKKESPLETRERRTENKRKERVYYEDEEEFEIDFSSRKSKRSFEDDEFESDSRNRKGREKTQEKFDEYEEVNLEDFEIEELEAVLDDFEDEVKEEETPVKKKTQVSVERFDSEPEEELEIEFVDEVKEEAKFEEIDITKYEEKEEKASAGTVTDLGDALKKLGVSSSEITDVDIFDEKPSRRKHPTLAAVRTKRLKQDHKIDTLGDSVVLGKDSSELKQEVATSFKGQAKEETQVQEERTTKNREARREFEENFNSLERRSDKIEKDNPLYAKKNEKLEGIFDEIREKESKTHEKEAPALEVRELDAEGSRREKLKYTSVHDVLEGNEDLFEDDIDRVSKKLVGERFEEGQESSEEVENFRKGLYEGKKSENTQERTALDELIKTENIDVSPRKEETLPEIEELNENLADLKKEKQEETYVDLVQEVAKIEDVEVEDYEEFKEVKKDRLSGYSDYRLDEEEIEELEEQNYLEESADSVNIDSLLREVSPNNKIIKKANDVDKFTDEKVVPKEVAEKRVEDAKVREESEVVEEVERGIDYTEKLYTNDVSEYFDKGNGTKLGEYKTVDHGYRPVSKEKIENNQKILDAIFEKYSSSGISSSTRSVTSQMMSSNTITPKSRSVGKFKPSPVYSSVYGSATRNTAENSNKPVGISTTGLSINNQVKKDEPKIAEKKAVEAKTATTVKNNANIYKEIASQEETVWNIGSAKRVPKNKVKNKK